MEMLNPGSICDGGTVPWENIGTHTDYCFEFCLMITQVGT